MTKTRGRVRAHDPARINATGVQLEVRGIPTDEEQVVARETA
jgi:hypothetical protein